MGGLHCQGGSGEQVDYIVKVDLVSRWDYIGRVNLVRRWDYVARIDLVSRWTT
jgi:hypothetical protein